MHWGCEHEGLATATASTAAHARRRLFRRRREAFALLSGSHPLMPSQLMGDIRKKEGVAGLKEKARRDPRGVVTFEVRR